MSLINKMLQDLDARGGSGESAVQQQEVKAVLPAERDRRPLVIAGAAAGVLVLAAGGWYGWHTWQTRNAPVAGPVPKIVDNRAPDKARLQELAAAAKQAGHADATTPGAAVVAAQDTGAASALSGAVASASASAMAGGGANGSAPASTSTSASPGANGLAPLAASAAGRAAAAPASVATASSPDAGDGAVRAPAAAKSSRPTAGRTSHADAGERAEASRVRKPAAVAHAGAADGVVVRDLTPKQISENSYRRALAALQEGRVNAALADLDKAVEVDPRNDAARQTYVSLLLEARRTDDAIRQLRLALGIDARQPGLAMVLARLQLEKGGPALDTLLKSLPYAGNNAAYLGFLAGVLQREQRHTEAAEQYRAALAMAPDNAVWWMGLGISLQADQHLPEAREAYQHARSGTGLTPELKSFIDRKLDQLSR